MEVQAGGRAGGQAVKFDSRRIIRTRAIAFLRIFQGFKIPADYFLLVSRMVQNLMTPQKW
jgi:hypothetical protein